MATQAQTSEAPREAETDREYLEYQGFSDERVINKSDFKDNGFPDGDKVVFNRGNRFRVPVADLPAEAAEWIAKHDPEFKIVKGK